jgi:hypothetical protein
MDLADTHGTFLWLIDLGSEPSLQNSRMLGVQVGRLENLQFSFVC